MKEFRLNKAALVARLESLAAKQFPDPEAVEAHLSGGNGKAERYKADSLFQAQAQIILEELVAAGFDIEKPISQFDSINGEELVFQQDGEHV